MDYLDPKKKKHKKIRLLVGYGLLAIAISIATVVLVFLTNGYYVDRESGAVIQNGLLYIDTKQDQAEIYLNGEKQRGTTDARLVVPEGRYDIELRREGYRDWKRSLNLEGGSLRRLTYARLIPQEIESEQALVMPEKLNDFSQSIDKRWIVTSYSTTPLVLRLIDLEATESSVEDIPLPVGIVDSAARGVWKVEEWANDNKTFLASYTTASDKKIIRIDHTQPENAQNLAAIFPRTSFTHVEFVDRKNDQVFLFNQPTGQLWRGNIKDGTITLVQGGIVRFKAFGDDALLFITDSDQTSAKVNVMLTVNNQTYMIRALDKVADAEKYLLDMSKLGNKYVVGVGSPAENRVIVFYDIEQAISQASSGVVPVPTTVLRVDNPKQMTISTDSSMIMAHNGAEFVSHEFEEDRSYSFSFEKAIDNSQIVRWVDGQHFTVSIDNIQYIADFDGSNQQKLVASDPLFGSFMNEGLEELYTLQSSTLSDGTVNYALVRSFMRTSADR